MPNPNDKVKNLYNTFVKDGYNMEPEAQFRENLKDPKKRKAAYDALVKDGYNMEPYAEFESNIGFGAAAKPAAPANSQSKPSAPAPQSQKPRQKPTAATRPAQKPRQSGTPLSEADKQKMLGETSQMLAQTQAGLQRTKNRMDYMSANTGLQVPKVKLGEKGGGIKLGQNNKVVSRKKLNPETGKEEQTFITESGNEFTGRAEADLEQNSVDDARYQLEHREDWLRQQRRVLAARLAKRGEELDAEAVDFSWRDMPRGSGGAIHTYNSSTVNGRFADTQYKNMLAQIKKIDDTLATLEEARKGIASDKWIDDSSSWAAKKGKQLLAFGAGAWRGLAHAVGKVSTWDMGLTDINTNGSVLDAAQNADRVGFDNISQDERDLLNLTAISNEVQSENADHIGWGYGAGEVTGESLPFMLEMILNPASGLGEAAVKRMTQEAIKRYGKEAVKKAAKKYLAAKIGTRLIGDAAGSAVMAGTSGLGHVTADTLNRLIGDVQFKQDETGHIVYGGRTGAEDSVAKAFIKAFGAQAIENHSEMVGEYFAPLLGKASKVIRKGMDKVGLGSVNRFIDNVGATNFAKMIGDFEKHSKWNGTIGEYAEEVVGNIENALLVGDNTLDTAKDTGVFNGEQNAKTFLGVGLMSGFISGAKTLSYRGPKRQAMNEMSEAGRAIDRAIGGDIHWMEKWGGWRNTFLVGTDEEKTAALREVMDNTDLPMGFRMGVLNFVKAAQKYEGLTRAQESKLQNGEQDPVAAGYDESYDRGYDTTEPEAMNDAKNLLDMKRGQLAQQLGIENADEVDDYIGDPLLYIDEQRRLGNTAGLQAVIDYANSKSAYEGMLQRVRDDIDSRVEESDHTVSSRVNRTDGMIHPATLKEQNEDGTGKNVYIVSGNVVMTDDGSGVDTEKSDDTIVIRDAQTGEMQQVAPDAIFHVDESIDPEEEKATAAEVIRQEMAQQAANNVDGAVPFAFGDSYTLTAPDGSQQSIAIVANEQGLVDNGDGTVNVTVDGQTVVPMSKEEIQQGVNATNMARTAQAEQERLAQQAETEQQRQAAEAEASRPQYGVNDIFTVTDENGMPIRGNVQGITEDGVEIYTETPLNGKRVQIVPAEEFEGMVDSINDADGNPIWARDVQQTNEDHIVDINNMVENVETGENKPSETSLSPTTPLTEEGATVEEEAPSTDETAPAEHQPSALERVPKNEKGEPVYEQTDPATAWDAIVEQTGGNEQMAKTVADSMVADKEAALKKAEKAKAKQGGTIAEKIAAEQERQAAIDNAKAELKHWQSIAMTQQSRRADAECVKAEKARKAAEARAEEEAKVKAEREEAERKEREAINGVPDWVDDTPQDARARGFRRSNGGKFDRQQPLVDSEYKPSEASLGLSEPRGEEGEGAKTAPIAVGKEVEVKFTDKVKQKGRVAVVEAAAMQPSHYNGQPNVLHFIPEAQPKKRTDDASVASSEDIAANINPEEITSSVTAYTGAPTLNARGEAIQGNNRTAALKRMWESHADQAAKYKLYLMDHAEEFGLNADDIAQMKQPVLANIVDVDDAKAIELGQYDVKDTESGGTERIKAKNAVVKMGNDMKHFASVLLSSSDDEASFSQLVDKNGDTVLKWMNQKGYITPTQYKSAFDSKGNLTAEAANDLKGIMYQSIFQNGNEWLEEVFNTLPAKAQRAILATMYRDYDSPAAERMVPEVQASIMAYNELMQNDSFAGAKNMKEAQMAVMMWQRQYQFDDATGESYLPTEKYSNFALQLAAMYRVQTQSLIQGTFNQMFDLIQGTQEANLFNQDTLDNTPRTLVEAIKEALNIDYNGQQRSNVLAGDSAASQQRKQGSRGDASADGRGESGSRTAEREGGTETADDNLSSKKSQPKQEVNIHDPRSMSDEEKLRRGEMLRDATAVEVAEGQIVATADMSARKAAEKWWQDNVPEPVFYDTEAGEVEINQNSIEDSLAHRYGQAKLDAITSLVEGFENAVYLGSMQDFTRQEDVVNHYFAYPIIYKGKRCYVFCRAMQDANKNRLYVHEVFVEDKIKEGNTLQTAASQPHGGIALYRDILANVLDRSTSSADKVTNNHRELQTNNEKNTGREEDSLSSKIAAASEEVNTEPTEAQKEAGNYKKGHVQVGTFDITIEQPEGSVRRGKDANGKQWESKMHNTYGYFRGTEGVDGDHIDVFLSTDIDGWNGRKVFVVDQYNPDGTFDEHKVMLGFNDMDEAKSDYLANYEKGWEEGRRIDVTAVNLEDFEKWIASSHRKTKPFSEYSSVKKESGTGEGKPSKASVGRGKNGSNEGNVSNESDGSNGAVTRPRRGGFWKIKNSERLKPGEFPDVAEKFAKEKAAFSEDFGDYADVLHESKTVMEAVGKFRKMAADARAEAKDWASRIYKKNKATIDSHDMYGEEKTTTVQAANERRRNSRVRAFEKAAAEYDEYAETLLVRCGLPKDYDSRKTDGGKPRYQKAEADDVEATAKEHGVDAAWLARYAEGMKEKNSSAAWGALHDLKAMYLREHTAEKKALMEREGVSGLIANRRLFAPIEKAIKEKFGDVDVLVEERRKQAEIERGVMEAARKRAEEEQRKREARLEELAQLTDEEIDKRYAEALDKGDEATAREMLDEAARRKGYGDAESDYQGVGAWSAPSDPGYDTAEERRAAVEENGGDVNVEDIAAGYSPVQEEMYSHPERTGFGDEAGIEAGRAINDALNALKAGKTDVKIKVYRAVPTSVKEGKLRNGDWVTPSRKYAENHGNSRLEGKFRIIEDEVPARELWFDGNDIREWGYDNSKSYRYKNAKNNRKLNDLVTRDDKGNVIPPSKRFNSRKADERYQKAGTAKAKTDKRERVLRDAVVDRLREGGLDVSMDSEWGQRVLDEANGEARMSAKKRRALETASVPHGEKHQPTVVSSADGAKVLNELDTAIENYENRANRPKTFLGDTAKALGATQDGSASEYATFETKNGKIVTIRLANHNATVSNFDHRGESEGISIVVSSKDNAGITNDGSAHVVEYYYDAIKLRRADGKPLADILRSIKQALYSGEFTDTTGLAERQEVNADDVVRYNKAYHGSAAEFDHFDHSHMGEGEGAQAFGWGTYVTEVEGIGRTYADTRFFRTDNGEAYGFTVGGKIYIDPRVADAETPVHEYAHLWATALKNGNPKEWQNVVGLMKGTTVWDDVRKRYPELETDDEVADEVLATYSGRRGAERLREEMRKASEVGGGVMEKAEAVGALERVREALKRFWKGVADFLHIHYTSAEEVADRVMKDLLDGVDPREVGVDEKVRKMSFGERYDYEAYPLGRVEPGLAGKEVEIVKADADHGFKNYKEARTWAKEHVARTYTGEETGGKGDVRISNGAVDKFLSQSAVDKSDTKDVHMAVLKVLPDVLRTSIDVETHPDFLKGEDGKRRAGNGINKDVLVHRCYGAVSIDGKPYRVKITLKENVKTRETTSTHSYEATKIELLAGQHGDVTMTSPRNSNSSISAAKLLKDVGMSYNPSEKVLDASEKRAEEAGEGEDMYRVVDDEATIERLDSEPKMTAYRAMQVIDGRLYSPMAAKVDGKLTADNPVGAWTEAEETVFDFTPEQKAAMEKLDNSKKKGDVEIIKGKLRYHKESEGGRGTLQFHLVKGDGTSLWAAYNPYIHSSLMMLNDQFTSAYKRPNIVVVEVEIPKSELTSGYRAERAKDPVGMAEWKAGPVAGQLPSDMGRKVMLSRWSKVKRIVPYSEVADHVASILEAAEAKNGERLTLPIDSFHPELRKELEKRGFKFEYGQYTKEKTDKNGNVQTAWDEKSDAEKRKAYKGASYMDDAAINELNEELGGKWLKREGDGAYSDEELSWANDPVSKMLGRNRWSKRQQGEFAARERERMASRVEELADKLHLNNVEVVADASVLEGRRKRAKGFYNKRSGKITIVIPNHASMADVEQTLLHEAVAHYGLRELFGEQFDTFLDNVYSHAELPIRKQIAKLARKNGWDFRKATEEYLASLAEDTDFEGMNKGRGFYGWWSFVKRAFLDMLHKIGFGEYDGPELSDNELRYILWRSYENLKEPGRYRSILGEAADMSKQMDLKVGNFAEREENDARMAGEESATIAAMKQNVTKLFEKARTGEFKGKPESIGRLSAEGKAYLENLSGLHLKEYVDFVLNPSDLNHIRSDHYGENEKDKGNNVPLTDEDIRNMVDVLNQPDGILYGVDKNDARKLFFFLKDAGNGLYNLTEVCSTKKGNFTAKSFFKSKKKGINQRVVEIEQSLLPTSVTYSGASLSSDAKIPNLFEMKEEKSENVSDEDDMFRDGDSVDYEKAQARNRYEERVSRGMYQMQEAMQDSMLGLKEAMDAILGAEGKKKQYIEDVAGYENAYLGENRLSSVNQAECNAFARTLFKPLLEEVARLAKTADERAELTDYMMAKHGLERNEVMARRAAEKKAKDEIGRIVKKLNHTINSKTVSASVKLKAAKKIAEMQALAIGIKNGLSASDAQKWYDRRRKAIDTRYANGHYNTEQYKKAVNKLSILYNNGLADWYNRGFRQRDYSGLTALTMTDNVVDAETEAQRMVSDYENSHDTTDLWDRVNNVTSATLSKTYESGLISKATYDDIRTMYKHYIPLRGFDEKTSDEAYAYLQDKHSAFNAPIKTAKGRKSKADDPFANMESMAESAIMQGNRNVLVKQKFLNFVLNHPSDLVSVSDLWLRYDDAADEWKPVNTGDVAGTERLEETDSPAEVERKMQDFEDAMEQLAAQEPDKWKKQKDNPDVPYRVVGEQDLREHQVLVKRGGKDYLLTINGNPRAAQALNGQTNPDSRMEGMFKHVFELAGDVNRTLSMVYTTLQPDFVVSNFMRDTLYANSMVWVKESPEYARKYNLNYVKTKRVMSLLGKLRKGTLDMNDETERQFKQFIENGGETGYMRMADIDEHKKEIKKFLKAANAKIPAHEVLDSWGTWLGEVSRGIEMRARFAAYLTSREMGRSIDRSIWDAKEISVNFNKKGAGDRFMDAQGQTMSGKTAAGMSGAGRAMFLFWNASIQGTFGNFGKNMVRHPKKMAAVIGANFMLGLLVSALAASGGDGDDDSYYDIPEHVRRQNFVVKGPGRTWIKVPLPMEYRAVYGMGELAGSTIFHGEELDAGELAGQMTQLLPVDMMEGTSGMWPSSIKPAVDVARNESWYGSPIWKETEWNQYRPQWTKAYKSANPDLVNLAAVLNEKTGGSKYRKGAVDMNPAAVEYLLKQYTGGFFTVVNQLRNLSEVAMGEKDFDWRYVPLANRGLMTGGDERNASRGLNDKFFRYLERYRAKDSEFYAIRSDATLSLEKKAELVSEIVSEPGFKEMRLASLKFSRLNTILKRLKETGDEGRAAKVERDIKELKLELVRKMEALDKRK